MHFHESGRDLVERERVVTRSSIQCHMPQKHKQLLELGLGLGSEPDRYIGTCPSPIRGRARVQPGGIPSSPAWRGVSVEAAKSSLEAA